MRYNNKSGRLMLETNRQQAGNGSTQLQVGTVVVNNGVNEKRVREIVNEKTAQILEHCSKEAKLVAQERCDEFMSRFLIRAKDCPAVFPAACEPSCQFTLRKALQTAASTNREKDLDLLTELLIKRFERNNDVHIKAGVNRAVEVVDQISDEELAAITTYALAEVITPRSGNIIEGFEVLSRIFSDILVNPLPDNNDWIYNLDILDVCRAVDFSQRNNIKDMFYQRLSGYAVKGIEYGSAAWSYAEELCKSASLNGIMVPHHLNPGHMRIPIAQESEIDNLYLVVNGGQNVPFDQRQLDVTRQLFDMCKGGDAEIVKSRFDEEWNKYPALVKLDEWWSGDKTAIRVTPCGRALAFANARRLSSEFPSLD